MSGPKFDLEVNITGIDSNIFILMGTVTKALRREMRENPESGITQQAVNDFVNEIMGCDTYDSALIVIMKTVEIS